MNNGTVPQEVRRIADTLTSTVTTIGVVNTMLIDEASSTVTYIGEATPGTATSAALWRIKKISVSGTVTTIAYADSNTNYDNVWDNRASLTYG